MADEKNVFKLFRTVDPSTVNVPIKDKFAKLTLSSNKKKQLANENTESKNSASKVNRQLLGELSVNTNQQTSQKTSHTIKMGADQKEPKAVQDESTQLDVSDYMEVLQLSGDGCTQRTEHSDVDVERLSTQVSNMTMQPKEVSICISSTTEDASENDDDNDEDSCITISDSETEQQQPEEQAEEPQSMAISEQPIPRTDAVALPTNKLQLMEAFLRDVSFERREMLRRGIADLSTDQLTHSRVASADTESMSQDIDITRLSLCSRSSRPLDSSKLLADNETEVNTLLEDSSKRLADNETEANTVCSEEQLELSCRRLAHDDTEEQPLSDHNTVQDDTIPETSSESEQSPVRSRTASASSAETEGELGTPAIQVSSINISAKINIKIHIESSNINLTSGESESQSEDDEQPEEHEKDEQSKQQTERQRQQKDRSILQDDASEDEQFLTNAEQLLNQLYGKSWQTPDVIRTLKRSSGSGGKIATAVGTKSKAPVVDRTPLTELRRQPKSRPAAATTAKKRLPSAKCNESALGDFSIFKRALHGNKLNSTHLSLAPKTAAKLTGTKSARVANKQQVRTRHIHEDRWRALVDPDSGSEASVASDDDDADATDCSLGSDDNAGHVTYLDLTKAEVQVVSSPDDNSDDKAHKCKNSIFYNLYLRYVFTSCYCTAPAFPKKLDDILRTCRATVKPKMAVTPSIGNMPPTRRQLFTPNFGYEDDESAKEIVARALDMNNLNELEIYQPGSAVHRRLQDVKRQLGIESPKGKPVFQLPTTPQATPSRTLALPKPKPKPKTPQPQVVPPSGKHSFLKSLESEVSREQADNEAYFYRENFKRNKEQLAKRLYDIYNEHVFKNKLDVPVVWSKTLRNTAGRCRNRRRHEVRTCLLELSLKVLTSADRLRNTLIHEMCHAASFIFDNDGGHGTTWRRWTLRAIAVYPELAPINVCHNYKIEFKYTYCCTTCNVGSNAHSRSRKVDNIRCRVCMGPIQLFINKKDKQGNTKMQPVREATGFAKFVKENFKQHKRPDLTAAQVMRILGAEYAKHKEQQNQATTGEASATDLIADQVETLAINDQVE
ncbi:hypothetical protein KR093_005635, partial [Drosophila rubida]